MLDLGDTHPPSFGPSAPRRRPSDGTKLPFCSVNMQLGGAFIQSTSATSLRLQPSREVFQILVCAESQPKHRAVPLGLRHAATVPFLGRYWTTFLDVLHLRGCGGGYGQSSRGALRGLQSLLANEPAKECVNEGDWDARDTRHSLGLSLHWTKVGGSSSLPISLSGKRRRRRRAGCQHGGQHAKKGPNTRMSGLPKHQG